ncbi:Outer membrane receptor proteins, mostly Fe transport [Sphingomonas sp. YR710]|uniref:TonB-dependent receptor domain-containing protein n=1 Tax=Sphingomonas sp. YR710 TaxID=1882773 RepID=UPI00087E224D|nr:TonB-dependent receptor [Sphingomonas sp. YR710]SDD78637.1 Outer membrane receptor proteins, mostly Fe transport [Sphingomonas sp. YR710]
MKILRLLLTVAPLALAAPAWADEADPAASAKPVASKANTSDMITTGVARGRDRLDSATSTSSIKEGEIEKTGARSLAELLRNIPGLRVEYGYGGEGQASISVRGLPLANGGAKFLQLEEDGLPVLEFGDIAFATADSFLRADLNIAQIESIRGGSSSTFSSNSPGGIINLISKTGDVEGGSVQASTGLDYESYRLDFDYGAKITDTLRFHFGGFYRQGEGPRRAGYDAYKGGQFKFNVTKQFEGGYIRLYGKYLDDRSPYVLNQIAGVSGTNSNPVFSDLPNYEANKDTPLSRYLTQNITLDENNNITKTDRRDGSHSVSKSIGVEAQFEVADWTITERFRYSGNSGSVNTNLIATASPAQALANSFAGPGAILSYATGPNAGQVISNPAALNGNGLMELLVPIDTRLNNLDNMTNDLRASRVWDISGGELTATAGFYKASQNINTVWQWSTVFADVIGGGNTNLINLTTAGGVPQTQNGYFAFGTAGIGGQRHDIYDVHYNVNAPYGSLNYHIGKIAIGASIRYDFGDAGGSLVGSELGTCPTGNPTCITSRDINGDGVISAAERRVSYFPITTPGPLNYDYHYVSYSTGINYRVAEPFSVFARYSRGGRAAADRILFGNIVNPVTGTLYRQSTAYDPVKQAEIGLKYRKSGLTLNVTGFWAKTHETNIGIDRGYRAFGAEFEGGYRRGIFSINAGATYTNAKITGDSVNAATVGNTPKHQPTFMYQVMPQIDVGRFTAGSDILGVTSAYSADVNQLKLPGYAVVNAFAQYRPVPRVTVSVNGNNLFNVKGVMDADASIPASGRARIIGINGRSIQTSLRFDF